VACESNGGGIDILPLMKVLYLSDKDLLRDYGRTISGDTHCSMRMGPVLSGAYNLCRGKDSDVEKQKEWSAAFQTDGNTLRPVAKVNTDVLAPVEEEILHTRTSFVMGLFAKGNLEDWMHANCPEWEDVSKSVKKSRPLSISRIVEIGLGKNPVESSAVASAEAYAVRVRETSKRTQKPLLA
jgi:uncharacterized phage-associated protein